MTHVPMQHPKGRLHPSGRPIRIQLVDSTNMSPTIPDEPKVPGLRRRTTDAVGFTHSYQEHDECDQ